MIQMRFFRTLFNVAALTAGSMSVGCSIKAASQPPEGEYGGEGGSGGSSDVAPATGGMAAVPGATGTLNTVGTVSTGSAPTGAPTALDYEGSTIQLCPGEQLVTLPLDSFEPCNMVGCAMAHCVPQVAVPAEVPIELLGICEDPTTVCVPDDYATTFGKFLAKTCESINGAEGRCISTCIPQINGLMDALPQADCGENERCAPCIHPNDGSETGACSQGCDPGPSEETLANPSLFATCMNGEGVCTPKTIIPEVLLTHLAQLDCPSVDMVCSPIEKAYNLKYNFAACTPTDPFVSVLAPPLPSGQMGGCVPAWVADTNVLEGLFLHQDSCEVGEKCAPCSNPLRLNIPTGACPVPLPSDPSGGLPPDGGSITSTSTGGAPATGGAGPTGTLP